MNIGFELTQVIECPVEQVFRFLAEPENLALWNYYVVSATKKSAGDTGYGTVFELKRRQDLHSYKVIDYTPPHKIKIELLPPGPAQQFAFVLSPKEGNTQVTYDWKVNLENYSLLKYIPSGFFKRWLLSFAERHVQKLIKSAVEENFHKLKTLLETGHVVLQDGRHISLPQ